jgi:hypothetical protein
LKKLKGYILHINENLHEILFNDEEHGIEVKIYEGSPRNVHKFNLCIFHNKEEGGFIVGEIIDNINYCAEEKSKKMQNSTATYDFLELALVDTIAFQYVNIYSKENVHLIENKIKKESGMWLRLLIRKIIRNFINFKIELVVLLNLFQSHNRLTVIS